MDLNLILNSTTWMLNVVYPDGLRKFFIAMFVLPPCRVKPLQIFLCDTTLH